MVFGTVVSVGSMLVVSVGSMLVVSLGSMLVVSLGSMLVPFAIITALIVVMIYQFTTNPHPIIPVRLHRNSMKLFSKFLGQFYTTHRFFYRLPTTFILNDSHQQPPY